MKKTTQLKDMFRRPELDFLMEAHNGLSAKIVEEAGFKGIWGSGLSISASLGVRDNNEASWTQVLEVVEFMSDATRIPILLDGDTGYGNFNNMRRLVRKLEQRGIAGVCIEDKIFPKTNSFIREDRQPLADIEEFCGKIKAGLDSRSDDDFCIVARVEAFIAGWGHQEALKRASAYHKAGADAILIHSKKTRADEILAFMKEWGDRCPVVIVPTKYYATPTQVFRDHKISVVIWANHLLRTAVTSMQNTAAHIFKAQGLMEVEDKIASVNEVFRLQNDEELMMAEKIYLTVKDSDKMKVVILAASRGIELGELTEDRPKALLPINGVPLLEKMLTLFNDQGIKDISVVRGYKKECFTSTNVKYFDNDQYQKTGELFSLYQAKEKIDGNTLISYGDILYRKHILSRLCEESGDIVIAVDNNLQRRKEGYRGDFVSCSRPETKAYVEGPVTLSIIQFQELTSSDLFHGEWIGLLKLSAKGAKELNLALEELSLGNYFATMKMHNLFEKLLEKKIPIHVMYIDGHWLDIDHFSDLSIGHSF